MKNIAFALLCALVFIGCAPKVEEPIKPSIPAPAAPVVIPPVVTPAIKPLKRVENPDFVSVIRVHPKEDADFFKALSLSKEYYSKKSIQSSTFVYDDVNYTGKQMLESLELFEKISKESSTYDEFIAAVRAKFDIYESKNEKNSSLITGYYAPTLKGSLKKTKKYGTPLYPLPKELVTANLKKFSPDLPKKELVGMVEKSEYVPFFTRAQIEEGALKATEPLLYLDNKIDSFFLEIQGSGIVETVEGKKLYVGYAGRNGKAYTSIGKVISQEKLIESDKINMYSIREYLMSNPDEAKRIMNKNESFVFFKLHEKAGIYGNIGLPLVGRHSVAMDSELIPKGSLAYIKTAIPYRKTPDETMIPRTQRQEFEKFFMVQDTGGAIRGGGRVDIYFGEGDEAFFYAAQMAGRGDVYLLVAKKEQLSTSIIMSKNR